MLIHGFEILSFNPPDSPGFARPDQIRKDIRNGSEIVLS